MPCTLRLSLLIGRGLLRLRSEGRTSKNLPTRDCLESPNGLHFVAPLACTTVRNGTFLAASRCQRTCHSTRTATFQRVSPRTPVNRDGSRRLIHLPTPAGVSPAPEVSSSE